MNCYLESACEQEICSKKSLKYLSPRSVAVGILHVCWSSIRHNIRDKRRTELKVKLLTGLYILQFKPTDLTLINNRVTHLEEPEDREHFVARCDSLEHVRKPYRQKFNMIIYNIIPSQKIDSIIFLHNWF